jgi:hypothetical protein
VATVINDLTMVSAHEGWAVGTAWLPPAGGKLNPSQIGFGTTSHPVILHYLNGTWRVEMS